MKRFSIVQLASVGIVALVIAFYWWTATSSPDERWSPDENSTFGTGHYYHMLANGFLAGHLYLPIKPAPEMLALPDPYDSKTNQKWRLHDASLYNGHYYLYFGPTPALVLFAPWKAVTGSPIAQNHACVIFLTLGYLFSCGLLFQLLRSSGINLTTPMRLLSIAALGLAQMAPIIARRTALVYEVPIVAGYCFFMGGAWFLSRAALRPQVRRWDPVLAGLFLGFAVGCRPHFVFAAIPLILYYAWRLRAGTASNPGSLSALARLAFPFLACCLLLARYNFARFDNPFEFGTSYQLVGQSGNFVAPSASHILPNLYYYLLSKPVWVPQFPFIYMFQQGAPFGNQDWSAGEFRGERLIGLLWAAPLCVLGMLMPLATFRKSLNDATPVFRMAFTLAVSALALFGVILLLPNLSVRYDLDFTPPLLVAGLFFSCWTASHASSTWARRSIMGLTVAGCAWGSIAGTALSIDSYNLGLKVRNPKAFAALVAAFGGDPNEVLFAFDGLQFQAKAIRSGPPGTQPEVLLTTGSPGSADFVFIQYAGPVTARFGYQHGADTPVLGPEVGPLPNPFELTITYGGPVEKRHVDVTVNGAPMFSAPAMFYFTAMKRIGFGRDLNGSALGLQPFGGVLQVSRLALGLEP